MQCFKVSYFQSLNLGPRFFLSRAVSQVKKSGIHTKNYNYQAVYMKWPELDRYSSKRRSLCSELESFMKKIYFSWCWNAWLRFLKTENSSTSCCVEGTAFISIHSQKHEGHMWAVCSFSEFISCSGHHVRQGVVPFCAFNIQQYLLGT